ncbi:MAG: GNAT family N-acetyltransferase [Methylobacteriaceae bacterium]|nr:GNAT family N-acetyltransferase [Methylobacteriaceae bacterium]
MVADLRRLMSMQHWPDEVRRFVGGRFSPAFAGEARSAEAGETLVESATFEALVQHKPAWRELARRALEPNPFLDPDFALTAIVNLPAGQRPEIVMIWQRAGADPRARLIGLWALDPRRSGPFAGASWSWRYKHSALGAPLIDRLAAVRSVDAMLDWLPQRRLSRSALAIPALVRDGPTFQLLAERCAARGLVWTRLDSYERAVLRPGRSIDETIACARSSKHRRELDRLARRLAEAGEVEFHSAASPEDIRTAAEWFLAVEQTGWKGARGTSFLADIGDTTFLRGALRSLARYGKCRIDWLSVDGRPVSMAIMLQSGDRAYFWKTAYDESYAQYSPGVQLARRLIERQLADPSVQITDSCAIADHPMIDRVWPDRQSMVDVLIGVDPTQSGSFPLTVRRERLRRALRAMLKSAAHAALRRRAS